jgi:hypothetical protein
MAISKGNSTESSNNYKRFTGIGNFTVLGVNPDLTTLHSWGVMVNNEPVYTGKQTDPDGNEVDYVRVTFYIKSVTIPDFITSVSFFVRRQPWYNKDKSKVKVIDIYGNDAWVTPEEAKSRAIPVSANGKKAKLVSDYRAAYRGEVEVTEFIKNLLNIADSHKYVNETWELADGAEERTCRFDNIKDWFDGDVSELRDALGYQTGNEIKLLCGIRTDDKGTIRQDVYTGLTMRAFAQNAGQRFAKEINSRTSNRTEYTFGPLKEWQVKPASPEEIEKAVEATTEEDDDNELPFD